MKKWKYLKGSEEDFLGNPRNILVVKSSSNGAIYHLGLDYKGRDKDIEKSGDTVIAYRQLIDEEQDLNECISSTEALIAERGTRYGKIQRRRGNHA